MNTVPALRIRQANAAPFRHSGKYVLYWMIAARRLSYNFALDRALQHCRAFKKPLLFFEPLRSDYPWASDRIHKFIIDGMADHAALCAKRRIAYYAYLETAPGAGKGLLEALARDACVVVTDDFPCFFLPHMVAAAARRLSVSLEAVDSNGLLPLRATDRVFTRAVDFRRYLQKHLHEHLAEFPAADPLARAKFQRPLRLPTTITRRWPLANSETLASPGSRLASFPIDHSVAPAATKGGYNSASRNLKFFLEHKLPAYCEHRNDADRDASSGLSPFLHFGHLSVHEVFARLIQHETWQIGKLSLRANGSREGWWNMSRSAEEFLDEIITWRELGYNFSSHRADYDQYRSLPQWSKATLKSHAKDQRPYLYSLEVFESAKTHDPLWNAAQTQLVREGRIHNYLRMLWGKKILEWSESPREALRIMLHLNNKYALDGRDPNSYSGIFWVLGRYDRPWPPDRAIVGVTRYMSPENTARKFSIENYVRTYS